MNYDCTFVVDRMCFLEFEICMCLVQGALECLVGDWTK